MLVGTMNPEEGELRPQLLDRFGLCVDVSGEHDPSARVEIIRRRRDYDADPTAFASRWAAEETALTDRVDRAHRLVPRITVSDELLFAVANLALSVGVDGHRADQAMTRAAAALAALDGRHEATIADVGRVAPLVLAHRVRRTLFDEPRIDSVAMAALIATALAEGGQREDTADYDEASAVLGEGQASIWDAIDASAGQAADTEQLGVLVAPADAVRLAQTGKQSGSTLVDARGRHTGSRPASDGVSAGDVALDATLRAAAPHQSAREATDGLAVRIEHGELQEKVRRHKVGATIVFCVDTSSSMGVAERVAAVRGAALELLRDAYQRRDRVAVVAFRGGGAELVLAPTASVQLAEMRLRELATGGATPLAAGLLESLRVIERERRRSPQIVPWIVVLSDGKANVGVSGGVGSSDALAAARRVKAAGVNAVVVDAGGVGGASAAAREVAAAAGARFL
jgi:magnesium chelatase subunit D